MKKIITTGFAFFCALCSAQITLTKDLSFGNNGIVQLSTGNPSSYQLFHYNTPTFQGDKLFINQPVYDATRKFSRLNHNGSLDTTFGTNGEVTFPTTPTTDYRFLSFYADANQFYLDSGEKYFSNGLQDTGFGNINTPLADNYLSHYKIILPDGKIISRNPQNIKKYLPTGAPDTTYGNNGVVALDPSLEFTLDKHGDLKHFDQNFLYEVVYSSYNQLPYIRKINIATGNLDLSYGQNGYSYFFGTLTLPQIYYGSSFVPQSNNLFIHNTYNSTDGQITRTNAAGILDSSFGINGEINYPASHILNGDQYEITENSPILYEDYVFLVFHFVDTNGVEKFEFRGYDYSGNPITINNNLHYIFQDLDPFEQLIFLIKDNYLYAFFDNKISRYIIGESTLSTQENVETKELFQFINPFHDELNFKTSEKIKSIEIYDESGRLVLKGKDSAINTSTLQKGVYLITITTQSNKLISKKGIKN
ncbi:T9SS type A sorting domain-containing protein [Chryseobacterium shigense]|uniref:Secretion system C-terminal sorting domain-containing protein n=1 Tax=Chryseobacterium shigense TaxID=297244 RepID=A0A841NKV7_9FLAO|nr:T9SS type A sorting domain-containing protein [Chryseobacterium shigense]MBB6371415.1 hypothetical protein [Chryseobacterium shigense]